MRRSRERRRAARPGVRAIPEQQQMRIAKPANRHHYAALVEFVEAWNRFLDRPLSREVLRKIEQKEENLRPLYADLEHHLSALSKRLH